LVSPGWQALAALVAEHVGEVADQVAGGRRVRAESTARRARPASALLRHSATVGIRARVKPADPRLLGPAHAARGYLAFTVGLGLAVTAWCWRSPGP
jgi:hypothetical protein